VNGALAFATAPDYEAPTDADTNNVYEVEVTADDGAGGTTIQKISVTVQPVNDNAPVFSSLASVNVQENTKPVVTLQATDADLPAPTISFHITGGVDAGLFTLVGNALSFTNAPDFEAPTDANADNVYLVQVTASDGTGGLIVQNITVTVTGVNDNAPIFSSPSTISVPENTTTVTTVAATDKDLPTPTLTYTITGGVDAGKFTLGAGNVLTFVTAPDYELPSDTNADNVYLVEITASDGVFSTVQSISVTVTDVNETLGQVYVQNRVLYILGTDLDDHVTVNTQGNGVIKVHADFLPTPFVTFKTADFDRIVARLFGGDDQMTIAGDVTFPALMDGGTGNDKLNAGGGPTIVIGGSGNDQLLGGSARSVLVGGTGADRIVGGSNDDLIIAGYTSYDANEAALLAILAEWNSSRSYNDRIANLGGTGTGTRLNGSYFLKKGTGATVFEDTDADTMTGAAGSDWYFLSLAYDTVTDRKSSEAQVA
jgi:hypothetical protein